MLAIENSCQKQMASPRSEQSTAELALKGNKIYSPKLFDLRDTALIASYKWNVFNADKEEELVCVWTKFEQNPKFEGQGTTFSIFDSDGKLIYEEKFSELISFYPVSALRTEADQLAMEIGYGGSGTYYLQLFDYDNRRIRNLLDRKDSEFNVQAEIKPQFQSGISSSREPFEIRLTRGIGLASPAEKRTSLYRYVNDRYRFIGEYSQQGADDFIESQIKNESLQK